MLLNNYPRVVMVKKQRYECSMQIKHKQQQITNGSSRLLTNISREISVSGDFKTVFPIKANKTTSKIRKFIKSKSKKPPKIPVDKHVFRRSHYQNVQNWKNISINNPSNCQYPSGQIVFRNQVPKGMDFFHQKIDSAKQF